MAPPCKIPGCCREPNRSVFQVPKPVEKREKWLKAIHQVFPNLHIDKNFRVCEKHFRKTDFTSSIVEKSGIILQEGSSKRKRLKGEAVPHFDTIELNLENNLRKPSSTGRNEPRTSNSRVLESHDIVDAELSTSTSTTTKCSTDMCHRWVHSDTHFEKVFLQNNFGVVCDVCDRLWFAQDLKEVTAEQKKVLAVSFLMQANSGALNTFKVCNTCRINLNKQKIPSLAKIHGFCYPPKPEGLPRLDPITERLVSPRLPFMQIRRLRREGAYSIIGQIINVPVDVNTMINLLPRRLDDDQVFNVNIKRNLIHKSIYLKGFVRKSVIKAWLDYLIETPLYRLYNIKVDWKAVEENSNNEEESENRSESDASVVEPINNNQEVPESEILLARQQTLLWNEDLCLDIAPGARSTPMNLLFDRHAEELSFPGIYYGVPRSFPPEIKVTPFMIATSEIRRRDRRGVIPSHILYMAMKILRHRVVDGLFSTFKCVQETEKITRQMLEKREFVEECVNRDLAFFKSVPNSVQYWSDRKKDVFAMIRQLGKPTMFMTLSANEIRWPHLLKILHKLNDEFQDIEIQDPLVDLSCSQRCNLVNEDPVTCCIYFNKFVNVIMNMIQSRGPQNPFGKYRVIDYFERIEFQQRGSPHAHILLWLANDPREAVGETMPKTIELVEQLCSVDRNDLEESKYKNQVHQHTFTCTKRGETSCRFHIPFWPMKESRVLIPMAKDDKRRETLRQKALKLRQVLEEKSYNTIEAFLTDNQLTWDSYLNIIRSTLQRPTFFFKRTPQEIFTNTFHPWIANVLNSNMDLQFILDEYSCASYVVEYVNKANRGLSNLHRHLLQLDDESFSSDYGTLLKRLGLKLLNSVEMSSQEAAWFLLRQSMSHCSRQIVYLPTVWPHERQKSRKTKAKMDAEKISPDSVDVWTKNIIQRYEERPPELEHLYLADFAANYVQRRSSKHSDNSDDDTEDSPKPKRRRMRRKKHTEIDLEESTDENNDSDAEYQTSHEANVYYPRRQSRIIRYRHYDIEDVENFKREMVLLYLPFRNELLDVLDRNKFIQLFNDNEQLIFERRREYEAKIDIAQVMAALEELCVREDKPLCKEDTHETFVKSVLGNEQRENTDDLDMITAGGSLAAVRRRKDVMPKQQYCEMLRTTNAEQRELIHELIHRMHTTDSEPLQIFFTGPAGCGKTYVLKAVMETVNRYSERHNSLTNAYIACASTGKAAVNLSGTTVHSIFNFSRQRRIDEQNLSSEQLQKYRSLFAGIKLVIIDEISMLSAYILMKIHCRLQEITASTDKPFGGMNIIFCGDLRQLPAVNARPIYVPCGKAIGGATLWQSLDYFELTRVVRQSDVTFSTILTKIGNGERLSPPELNMIESRFRNSEWCDQNIPDVTRLYHRNSDVDQYNMKVLKSPTPCLAHDVFIGYQTKKDLTDARTQLHKMSTVETHGLPYLLNLAKGNPYMITSNIDLEDGLVNGVIGTLVHFEVTDDIDLHEPMPGPSNADETNTIRSQHFRVWLEFENEAIGQKSRIKCRPHVMANRNILQLNWTPIDRRTGTISLHKKVKCKRTQLPLVPACAITIHKAQGGTFENIVYQYDASQQTPLVYVALSRVTTLEGLYLTNAKNDFTFHHGRRESSEALKMIRNEYERLKNHRLSTLTCRVKNFIEDIDSKRTSNEPQADRVQKIIIVNMNVQSIAAHTGDISTDFILQRAQYLVCSETWMSDTEPPTEICGFVCESRQNKMTRTEKRLAGGIAIYKNIESFTTCVPIDEITDETYLHTNSVGDFTSVKVLFKDSRKFILAAVYIHPKTPIDEIKLFLFQSLLRYSQAIKKILPTMEPDVDTPIILCGDFNFDIYTNQSLLHFMKKEFDLECCPTSSTTLGNTHLDLTFTRNLNIELLQYVSYFSYHRPVINKLSLKH